ncbi:MAG: hypothetical protein ACK5LP_04315 [Campylobacteraceae bacterium]
MNKMSRRTFIKSAIGTVALSSAPFKLKANWQDEKLPPIENFDLIYDKNFTSSLDFVNILKGKTESIHEIAGDINTSLYNSLNDGFTKNKTTLIGIGSAESLFILEKIANDKGMRVIFKSSHELLKDGTILHSFDASYPVLRTLTKEFSNSKDSDWVKILADVLQTIPNQKIGSMDSFTSISKDKYELNKPIHTWVIAPKIS